MGKSLIIKGADFSQNAVQREYTWFVTECTSFGSGANTSANRANGGWAFGDRAQSNLRGKTINVMRFKPSASGTLNIYHASSLDATSLTLLGAISISANDVGIITMYEFAEIAIPNTGYLVVGEANTTGAMYYNRSASGVGFYTKIGSGAHQSINYQSLSFDIGYVS